MNEPDLQDQEVQERLVRWRRRALLAGCSLVWLVLIGGHYYHRSILGLRGVETTAKVETHLLKACYGFRCGNPVWFNGARTDPKFAEFQQAHCHVINQYGDNCQEYLRISFNYLGNARSELVFVEKVRLLNLGPGDQVRIRFDSKNPQRLDVVGDTQDDIDRIVFLVLKIVGVLVAYAGLLGLGCWLASKRKDPDWTGPNYS